MATHIKDFAIGTSTIRIETGRFAKQANGAVTIQNGGTIVLATSCSSDEVKEGQDFFPLTVNYLERTYAAGKIPGGFFKREGRPSEKEVLASRLIDRPIRPLFPKGYLYDIQIIAMVLSYDQINESEVPAIIAASSALTISDIPFNGPVGAVRLGYIDGNIVINPSLKALGESEINIIVAGTENAITMLEGNMKEVEEDVIIQGIEQAHQEIKKIVEVQRELQSEVGIPKREFIPIKLPDDIGEEIRKKVDEDVKTANTIPTKQEREDYVKSVVKKVQEDYDEELKSLIYEYIEEYRASIIRKNIVSGGLRLDGRKSDEIRNLTCEIGILPRVHGSAVFTRGQTQSLCAVTLGTKEDEQRVEQLTEESSKRFMVHYNFPPFSVGEVSSLRGPGRREIGHGALAERSLKYMIPDEDKFPYTIRVVSDILESNGSSSMATVCGASLALMDAGVPIKNPVAGIAMGVIKEGDKWAILTDIAGEEDHYGDMDFKVAGTKNGITGIQMDTKISELSLEILKKGLEEAKKARLYILDIMVQSIPEPRKELSPYAPRLLLIQIPQKKIGEIIGPGGKIIRNIIEQSGAKVEISDDGKVMISSADGDSLQKAQSMIEDIVKEVEVGQIFNGTVIKIMPFGAFVKIKNGKEGLVHISQIANHRVKDVKDVLKIGDEIQVKVIKIDDQGRINLSRKVLLKPEEE